MLTTKIHNSNLFCRLCLADLKWRSSCFTHLVNSRSVSGSFGSRCQSSFKYRNAHHFNSAYVCGSGRGGADGDEGGGGKGCLLTLSWRKETIVSLTLYAFYKKWGKREDSISHEPLPPRLRQPLKKGSHNVKCRTTVY